MTTICNMFQFKGTIRYHQKSFVAPKLKQCFITFKRCLLLLNFQDFFIEFMYTEESFVTLILPYFKKCHTASKYLNKGEKRHMIVTNRPYLSTKDCPSFSTECLISVNPSFLDKPAGCSS